MLVVRVELWPGGDPSRAETLGSAAIANVSDLARVSDYVAVTMDGRGAITGIRQVHGHRRSAGFWPLVARAVRPTTAPLPGWVKKLAEHMHQRVVAADAPAADSRDPDAPAVEAQAS